MNKLKVLTGTVPMSSEVVTVNGSLVKVHMGTGTMCILIIAELLQFRFSHTHQPLAVIGLFA